MANRDYCSVKNCRYNSSSNKRTKRVSLHKIPTQSNLKTIWKWKREHLQERVVSEGVRLIASEYLSLMEMDILWNYVNWFCKSFQCLDSGQVTFRNLQNYKINFSYCLLLPGNKFQLHPSKCNKLRLTFARSPTKDELVEIAGCKIHTVQVVKLLGAYIQEELKWNSHVREMMKKLSWQTPVFFSVTKARQSSSWRPSSVLCCLHPICFTLWLPGLSF